MLEKRGEKGFSFFATLDEVQRWVLEALPTEFEPYEFVGTDLVLPSGQKFYSEQPFHCEVDQLRKCLEVQVETADPRRRVWIRSRQLHSAFDPCESEGPPDSTMSSDFSLGGLILLDFGSTWGKKEEFTLAIVHRTEDSETGAIKEAREYLKVYEALKRRIRRELGYTAIRTFPDGTRLEDKSCLISEGAAEEIRRGVPHSVELGNLVKPKRRA